MKDSANYLEEVILPLFQAIHFYAAMIVGWWFFHNGIYPLAYFAKDATLAAQLPIYAVNVMAFGCLVYVATRPVVLLVMELARSFKRAIDRHGGLR